ncbi:MAG: glutathione-disulfide reductase [Alphaproteobacteria bacterium]|nr:glutathione-disulfide reductase [Alphaproteobacteria bacterium]
MAKFDFDLLTIGAGSGGVAATRRAASHGAKTAICEEDRVGGTCVLRGCVPKKLLVYGSHFADAFEDAAGFGWQVGPRDFDWARLVARKDRELDRLNSIYLEMLDKAGTQLLAGRARLVDAHTVDIAGRTVTAKTILIATGSWPDLPDIPGIAHAITSNEALSLPELPTRIAIVGGGYIAVEFAGIFRRFGVEVTEIIRSDQILRGFDGDIRATLTEEMKHAGIKIEANTTVQRIDKKNKRFELHMQRVGQAQHTVIEADLVMYATGRTPNTKEMGLEELGVGLDPNGAIRVNEGSRSTVTNLYAVGDCTDRLNLTPVAIGEGRALADTLYGGKPRAMDHSGVPTAVFSQPPIGTVGFGEEEARERFDAVDVYLSKFRPLKHTLSGRETRTMMKLVVERASDRVLGCHMVGEDAPEIVQALAIALKAGARKADFDATVGIHPTAAEEFVTMFEAVRPDNEEN